MISDHSLYTKIKIPINFAGAGGISVQESGISLQHPKAADPFGNIVATRV